MVVYIKKWLHVSLANILFQNLFWHVFWHMYVSKDEL